MTNYDEKPEVRVTQAGDSSIGIGIIIAALVLVVGAFLFFNNSFGTTTDNPKVVQNNTTLPAPVIEVPAKPEVVTPPAPKATTPSADAPAANP
jgi:hypothetical protein